MANNSDNVVSYILNTSSPGLNSSVSIPYSLYSSKVLRFTIYFILSDNYTY